MSVPFEHAAAIDAVRRAAEALRLAEADVVRCKAALVADLPRPTDPSDARRFAVEAYWAVLEIPTEVLAEIGTGLAGGRAIHAFTRTMTARDSGVACRRCGRPIVVRSREQMRRLADKGAGHCDACTPSREVLKGLAAPEPPRRNLSPEPFEREVLQLHADRGQSAMVNVVWIWGGRDLEMSPGQIRLFLQDPDLGVASASGVSKDDYLGWLDVDGSIQCDAQTKAGSRCRNRVAGVASEDPVEWVKLREDGGYCTTHGG